MKRIIRCSILLMAFLLTACGSTLTPTPQDPAQLSVNHGYVFVEFPVRANVLTIQALSDGKRYELAPGNEPDVSGRWVPPGEYELIKIQSSTFQISDVTEFSNVPPFTVETGKVTHIGTLAEFKLGGRRIVWTQNPSNPKDGRFSRWMKENVSYLSDPTPVVWQVSDFHKRFADRTIVETEKSAESGTLYRAMLKIAQPTMSDSESTVIKLRSLKDGTQFFPAQLGQIKRRSASGQWFSIDTGYTAPVSALYVDEKTFYAGLATGKLLRSEDQGDTWKEAALFTNEKLTDIHLMGDSIYVFTHAKDKTIRLYTSSLNEALVFTELARSSDAQRHESMSQRVGADLYFNLSKDNLLRLNTITGNISEIAIPAELINYYVDSSGTITVMVRKVFGSLYVSDTSGANWTQVSFPKMGKAYFRSLKEGKAFAWGEIKRYDSSNDSWKSLAAFKEGCFYTLVNETNLDAFCADKVGNIFRFEEGRWFKEAL